MKGYTQLKLKLIDNDFVSIIGLYRRVGTLDINITEEEIINEEKVNIGTDNMGYRQIYNEIIEIREHIKFKIRTDKK